MIRKAIEESNVTKAVEDSKRVQYMPPPQPYPNVGTSITGDDHTEENGSEIGQDKEMGKEGKNYQVL